jgi:hypothetical protein
MTRLVKLALAAAVILGASTYPGSTRSSVDTNSGGHAPRGSIHNSSGDSHITSDGNGCTILSTPSGSLSSGC